MTSPQATTEFDSTANSGHRELAELREHLRARYTMSEPEVIKEVLAGLTLDDAQLATIHQDAVALVVSLRTHSKPTMMESFLSEYGLSTPEGVGLMCLAEALLRVPDATTIDELIADKLESSDWAAHLGQSSSPLVNASTWALMLTGRMLDETTNPTRSLSSLVRRVGEPVVRTAVAQAMKLLGRQFVLGETIELAIREAQDLEKQGYTYSYDMLGEAAHTQQDAHRYAQAYSHAIKNLARVPGSSVRNRPGISVKLSALHPRYEYSHHMQVMNDLLPVLKQLAKQAATAGIGFNIDAEEADRLDLSLDLIEALLADPELADWDGLGIVVQAYSRRALPTIHWLLGATRVYQRRVMVRLVKGAYWDSEIKQAQELGLASFPVFTQKVNTDVSYLRAAQLLLANRDRIYPQFATHNAHSVCAIRLMAGSDTDSYEFQRLHGMGESLHEQIHQQYNTQCRIYAPVGAHRDLLAYLVRRLLENGANSSFVNQIVDTRIAPEQVASCPVRQLRASHILVHPSIAHPLDLYLPQRQNSKGYRTNDPASVAPLLQARDAFQYTQWQAAAIIGKRNTEQQQSSALLSPSNADDIVGHVIAASTTEVEHAIQQAIDFRKTWANTPTINRAQMLNRAADAYEACMAEFCALLCREAGKTLNDAISEVREAVDFLRYYAACGVEHNDQTTNVDHDIPGHGVVVCISPWNFPLAIFTGQIAGALMGGNTVLAKPAEQTPLVAAQAISLLHQAGIPVHALQFLPGDGTTVGQQLSADPRIDGICFTGSTHTARLIEQALASRTPTDIHAGASANPLFMAETGGLNAMIVDSSALTEQVVRDSVASAFQSSGQRCSALRILYVQKEAEQRLVTMLCGAMDALTVGDPWYLQTDVGPVIDDTAHTMISEYIAEHRQAGNLLHQTAHTPDTPAHCSGSRSNSSADHGLTSLPTNTTVVNHITTAGRWIAPTLIKVSGIADMPHEIFGPVLHIATFEASELNRVVEQINERGYGLTFGLHTRIDDRVQQVVDAIKVGNVYVNRNQIGAVVGSQPFGGEGLSGTGPKAGGPWYVKRLMNVALDVATPADTNESTINAGLVMPGPTGESNHWRTAPRENVLIIGDDNSATHELREKIQALGCTVKVVDDESIQSNLLALVQNQAIDVVVAQAATAESILHYRQQLSRGDGPLIQLVTNARDTSRFLLERHVCIDTTAAGGNACLLGSIS